MEKLVSLMHHWRPQLTVLINYDLNCLLKTETNFKNEILTKTSICALSKPLHNQKAAWFTPKHTSLHLRQIVGIVKKKAGSEVQWFKRSSKSPMHHYVWTAKTSCVHVSSCKCMSDPEVSVGQVAPLCHRVRDAKCALVSGAMRVTCTEISSQETVIPVHTERETLYCLISTLVIIVVIILYIYISTSS